MAAFIRYDSFTGIFAPITGAENPVCAMLIDNNWTENTTDTTIADIASYEITDAGYQRVHLEHAGGQVCTSTDTLLYGADSIDYYIFTPNDPAYFTNASWLVLYEDVTTNLLCYVPFAIPQGYDLHTALIKTNETIEFYTLGDDL